MVARSHNSKSLVFTFDPWHSHYVKLQGAGASVLPLKHNRAQITGCSHLKTDCPRKEGPGWMGALLEVKRGANAGSFHTSVFTPRPHPVSSELLLIYYVISKPETCYKLLSFSLCSEGNVMLVSLFALEARKHEYIYIYPY